MAKPDLLDLDARTGWPDELRLFLDRFPRAEWPPREQIGPLTRFWLDIHDGFRSFAGKLAAATGEFREQRVAPAHFRSWFAPRIDMFLSHLEGHHQIEDYQYFPLFVAAEGRLKRGFDVLENDHVTIHAQMDRLAEAAHGFLGIAPEDADGLRLAGDAYANASERLFDLLNRHLDDEEDLIVPVILARGELDLGL